MVGRGPSPPGSFSSPFGRVGEGLPCIMACSICVY
nr:MAG TPA: hypothetical protein [Caudoviricetes sp.]